MRASVKNIVLVGVGGYGRNWVRILANSPEFRVAGIVDIAKESIRNAVDALNLDSNQVFSSLGPALEQTKPDLVVDTTPPKFRLQWARQVFAHGAHLIVAKPLAERLSDALEMIDLAERHGCRLAVNQQQRYHVVAQTLARLVQEGRIGSHVCTYFSFFERRQWQDRLVEVPSPLFVESSIHHFDLFRAVLGKGIRQVNAVGWTPPDIGAVGKTAGNAWIELDDGTFVTYQATRSARTDLDPTYKTGWQGPWIIEGTQGVLRGGDKEGVFLNGECVLTPDAVRVKMAETNMDTSFFKAFVAAIEKAEPFPLEGKENVKTLAAAHAAEISIQSGAWVEVDSLLRG